MFQFMFLLIFYIPLGYAANPCCSHPCQNRGVCMTVGFDRYWCDCTRTGFYDRHCSTPEFLTRIKLLLKPTPDTVHYVLTHFPTLWWIVNNVPFLRNAVMRYILLTRSEMIDSPPLYNLDYGYNSWEAFSNLSYYTRTLPPVPRDCPTPLGVKGKARLPDSTQIVDKVFIRRTFIPDPQGTNLMFAFFGQHFTHQFFRTDMVRGPAFTTGLGHGVDLSHIYGETLEKQHKLRLFKDGKMKYQVIDGEMYPPTVKETQVHMLYAPEVPDDLRFAVGNEVFGLVPGLMMYATIWLREHNRVCDVLKHEHPEWGDEQLFQTTRLIITGETINIIITQYVQQLSGYHFQLIFDPELLFGTAFQYQNRIAAEFNTLYRWHSLLPDDFRIGDAKYGYEHFVYNNSILIKHGIAQLVESFTRQIAGRISGGRNIPPALRRVSREGIEHGRKMRYQSLNEYRKRFRLKPYESFEELTGEKEIAAELEALYGDVEAVELYTGFIVEKPRPGAIFGESIIELGAPFSLKGLMANVICSPAYWKPSTFGGDVGLDIVKTATIQSLICANVKGCPLAAFRVSNAELLKAFNGSSPSSLYSEQKAGSRVLINSRTEL
ncbi:prostaglandin G/H synthase 2 [Cercopithecine betaherpesvirus 5]|uniref:Prostaglandin G/H synthase 2 n=1 Tax=Simian cytomegalovirus (strain Colburn) TaxID=50292 RepID=G8XT72_SCMVC|nr:prostaglandin G/H synthase 2 [Cercopithecine betaherpesvirus 5]AEV80364.1 prostaglandin G/H synthase 2 [Cercopithecine betaherpesvirus 5]